MTAAARELTGLLTDPARAGEVADWTALVSAARAESLAGTLAWRLAGVPLPREVERLMEDARRASETVRVEALWEAEMARRALAPLGVPVVLLKGTAYAAAGLPAAEGRSIGDLDILVPARSLPEVERALLAAGWEWVKEDAYDDLYYRRWMHELPPLIHRARDRMIDVHHTILPLTARPKPDAEAMIADSAALGNGLRALAPADMVVHASAHLIADGDLAGGLRNLWDIDRLLRHFAGADAGFWAELQARAGHHRLWRAVHRAARLANDLYATPIPESWRIWDSADPLFRARMLARDGWGRQTARGLRFGFYVRSHLLRMPPLMLARHLLAKARR
ncbi:MAG: nucleotidyltransferase family protein [Alphaproteobacteria bacterium]|nr:nucleotidyltransferase family protein [Alphaproteobacteria bacterium]